jgi:hypothetical protein
VKLILRDNIISLAAQTDEEREICALLSAADGHVFRLACSTDNGFSLQEIGPEAEARRAPLNITRSVEARFAPISNLSRAPFELNGIRIASVEAFWQGLKYPDAARRDAIARLSGPEAKDAGSAAGRPETIDYGGSSIRTGSPEHWALMRDACHAKFTQHQGARDALLATGERWLTHRVRNDSRTIPGVIMADIWMSIWRQLRGEPEGA